MKALITAILALVLFASTAQADIRHRGYPVRVWITGYDLVGITASGMYTGPGRVAVDPSIFPLRRTRFWIPGYGSAIAADTGPGVYGYHIDVWLPTWYDCLRATGYRTVWVYQ